MLVFVDLHQIYIQLILIISSSSECKDMEKKKKNRIETFNSTAQIMFYQTTGSIWQSKAIFFVQISY